MSRTVVAPGACFRGRSGHSPFSDSSRWQRKAVFGLVTKDARRGWLILGAVAEPLLYAGIIGNVIDRLFRGYVIDMFDFHWGVHHFPCFNIADSCICVAVGLLLLTSLRSETK